MLRENLMYLACAALRARTCSSVRSSSFAGASSSEEPEPWASESEDGPPLGDGGWDLVASSWVDCLAKALATACEVAGAGLSILGSIVLVFDALVLLPFVLVTPPDLALAFTAVFKVFFGDAFALGL